MVAFTSFNSPRCGSISTFLKPALPGWLFTPDGRVSFTFLGQCAVTYYNPQRLDTFAPEMQIRRFVLTTAQGERLEMPGDTLGAPYAAQVRAGQIRRLELFF